MDVTTRKEGETYFIKISGIVEASTVDKLIKEMDMATQEKPKRVVMDLSLVPTIDSSGIGKILIFFKRLSSINSDFEIRGIQQNLYNIFKAIKLDKLFPITMK
jgi:anti-sigma B factor antagonist